MPAPSPPPRVLIVEDEAHLARGIQFNLEAEGFDVRVAAEGHQALEWLAAGQGAPPFDLVILDVMLPGIDGIQVAERMREAGDYAPILMLTAKSQPEDVVRGLEAGADDYLAKPFDLPVLLARVRGLLRRRDWARGAPGEPEVCRIGAAEVDFGAFAVRSPEGTFRLTLLETALLKHLVQNAGRVVTKSEILEKVWNVHAETRTRAVDNFIVRLRRYLERDPRAPQHLHTVRGAGYRLTLD